MSKKTILLTPTVLCSENASTPPNLPLPPSSAEANCVLAYFTSSRLMSIVGSAFFEKTQTHGFFVSMYGGGRIEMELDDRCV